MVADGVQPGTGNLTAGFDDYGTHGHFRLRTGPASPGPGIVERVRRTLCVVTGVVAIAVAGCTVPATPAVPAAPGSTRTAASTTAPGTTTSADQDPARYAESVVRHAREAAVSPQLVMAILYNESYKPHDPALERAWQQMDSDAAFGVANMHQAAFEQTRRGRAFAGRAWTELPDDPDLAVQAEAWYLHDLAGQLPARHSDAYTADELLALGYNAGPSNMKAFAKGTRPGARAQQYLTTLRENWAKAGHAVGS